MDYIDKAHLLTKHFNLYGYGNFDLYLDEIAYIIELLETNKNKNDLDTNLTELYDRLKKQRLD